MRTVLRTSFATPLVDAAHLLLAVLERGLDHNKADAEVMS
jgi:hypothetical protein